MRFYRVVLAVLFSAISGGIAWGSELSEAIALKDDAMAIFRAQGDKTVDPVVYADAIKKLERAQELLEALKKTDPVQADAVGTEVASARFWAQKFATVQVADALAGKKPVPAPTPTDKPPATPAKPADAPDPAAAAAPSGSGSEDLRDAAARLREEGKFDEAKEKLKEYLAQLDKKTAGANPDLSALAKVRDYFFDEGSYNLAEVYGKRVVDGMEKLPKIHPTLLALDLCKQGDIYAALCKFPQAETLFKRVLAAREKFFGADHPECAIVLDKLGMLYSDQSKWDLAELNLKKAQAIRQKALKPGDPEFAKSFSALGTLYQRQCKYVESSAQTTQAIKLLEDAYGPDHALLSRPLADLAFTRLRQEQADEAEKLAARSLAIAERSSGLEHPNTAWSLNVLAIAYGMQGKPETEALYKRALAIREKSLGLNHVDVGTSLMNYATYIINNPNRLKEAEDYLKRTEAIWLRGYGSEHRCIVKIGTNLALVYRLEKKFPEAESVIMKTMPLCEKLYGTAVDEYGLLLLNLANVYFEEIKYLQAIEYYKRSETNFEKSIGPKSELLKQSLLWHERALRKLNRNTEADQIGARLKAITASP